MAYVYILTCADGSLYTGAARDVRRRVEQHAAGAASRYTRSRLPVVLVWSRRVRSWRHALRLEWRIKQLTRDEKLALVSGGVLGRLLLFSCLAAGARFAPACILQRRSRDDGRPRVRKLILRNFQSPGDILMLTAAVRDLHACHPGEFLTDVRTPCPDLWLHNPHLTPLRDDEPGVELVDCHYPLIHRSNTSPYHFIHGFIEYLNDTLGLRIKPTLFKGDVHLSPEEREWFRRVEDAKGRPPRFWLFASGGKHDYTIKWWSPARYQQVVDHFAGRLDFVQVGEDNHHHPPLERVLDLRGQTTLRQLLRLMYHAEGAVSAVSLLMHLAAAVETKPRLPRSRPCVVIAGGREPSHFTFYPHHQYLHTLGALACCDQGGCWKSRVRPLGDGDPKDEELCVDVVGELPRCMDMITAADVIRAVERYYDGGALPPLDGTRPALAEDALAASGA